MKRYLPLLARVSLSLLFLKAGIHNLIHFSTFMTTVAKTGLPLAGVFAFLTTAIQLVGGIMVAIGYQTQIGAGLLIAFLVIITLAFQNFLLDPSLINESLKNIGLMGGLLMILYAGPGPISIDSRKRR